MQPGIAIFIAWILFGGTHLLLSSSSLRAKLSDRFGPRGFTMFYAAVTTVTMGLLMASAAIFGDRGNPGLAIGSYSYAAWFLGAIALAGTALAVAGLVNYPRSPMAVLARRQRGQKPDIMTPLKPPTVVERISRHPFFAGLAMLMSAHALLASTFSNLIFFAGFAVLAIIGIPMQDRKLRQRWKQVYGDFEAETSAVPFAKPMPPASAGEASDFKASLIRVLVLTVAVGALHPVWEYANGAAFAGLVLAFGLIATARGLSKSG